MVTDGQREQMAGHLAGLDELLAQAEQAGDNRSAFLVEVMIDMGREYLDPASVSLSA